MFQWHHSVWYKSYMNTSTDKVSVILSKFAIVLSLITSLFLSSRCMFMLFHQHLYLGTELSYDRVRSRDCVTTTKIFSIINPQEQERDALGPKSL